MESRIRMQTCIPLFRVVSQASLVSDMATLTLAEYRRILMTLAGALSEPSRWFSPEQVMLKGHDLNPGQVHHEVFCEHVQGSPSSEVRS